MTALTLEDLPAADPHRENQRGELEASLDVVEPARLASWRSNLEEVVRQTRRCGEIVKHLLEFSRQHRVSAEPVDVNALVERTLALLERQSIFLNVKVERRLDPALPAVVADPSQLQQVFVNVLVNAVQAMEERGTLTVATGHDPRTGEVVLTFRDTGCGIPADQLDRIFDPFFTTKESGQGTGLGLSIAYGIVSRHSGTIGVESTPGAGTTLSIRLPAVASRELAAVPQEVTA